MMIVVLTASCATTEGDERVVPDDGAGGVSAEMREAGEALARRDGNQMAIGDTDAPVVLIGYSDYQCPYCKRWVDDIQPELIEDYVDEGTLRIEWREFPYLGESSRTLALGAQAAAEQDMYWEYHDAVFEEFEEFEELGDADSELTEHIETTAEDAGLDGARLVEDMRADATATAVDRDLTEGQRMGVSGAPAFLINGQPVMGAQPLEVFNDSVEAALAETDE